MKKQNIRFTSLLVGIGCLTFLAHIHAVNPPPDGCYPNFTTAEGCKALQSLTSGAGNTAIGWYSLFGTTTGSFNTAVGAGALDLNTADNNTAVGVAALLLNTIGTNNTANGVGALVFNNADENTATGAFALSNNTEGNFNTANGAFALDFNTTGDQNTATGVEALMSNTTGSSNTALGNETLTSNTSGNLNVAIGHHALNSNTTEGGNTAVGSDALINYTSGGGGNTAIGDQALFASNAGTLNTALGFAAGQNVTTASNTICIGADGENVSNSCYIGHIFGATSAGGVGAIVNAAGKLGTVASSRRFKEGITSMGQASETLFALKPVTFHYKQEFDPTAMAQFGLVAEEVEKINPDLIVRDKEGNPYSVRYDAVNAMLLNEFLKEHQKVQRLESHLKEQQKQIESLSANLQQVISEVRTNKTTREVVASNP